MPDTAALPGNVPEQNVTVDPRQLHMEVFDARTGDVWLQQAPVSEDDYRAFRPEPPYVKSGLARSAMDAAHFLKSPGAPADGALETRIIGGRSLVRVARPLNFRGLSRGDAPTRLEVDKHHRLGFDAGTLVRLALLPDGRFYVQQTVTAGPERLPVPADWTMHLLRPRERWWVYLGSPVTVYFFRNLTSFMGPLTREQLPVSPEIATPDPL
jgi:hypothetical protein